MSLDRSHPSPPWIRRKATCCPAALTQGKSHSRSQGPGHHRFCHQRLGWLTPDDYQDGGSLGLVFLRAPNFQRRGPGLPHDARAGFLKMHHLRRVRNRKRDIQSEGYGLSRASRLHRTAFRCWHVGANGSTRA